MFNTTVSGSGPVLVWAHGLMHSMDFETRTGWFHPTENDGVCRVRYDARGHGHSPGGTDSAAYLWSAQADDLLAIASAHTALPRALGGHSMGAASALLAALKSPELTSCLILATPPTAWQTRPRQVHRYRQMQRIIEQRGLSSLVNLTMQNPALPDWLLQAHPQHAAASQQALSGMHAPTLTAILEAACACDLPARSALHHLEVPTLILGWRDDPIHPTQSAELLAEALPVADLHIIDSASVLQRWPLQISEFVRRHTAG